ncbi:CynX/NimT family MFS transporter [uncultured Psychrobacter sp.]|uniref:MFS transporter n=1 Tax=uncultured Psychrobacter sp. TaxID=259303 RepID=UPI00345830F9
MSNFTAKNTVSHDQSSSQTINKPSSFKTNWLAVSMVVTAGIIAALQVGKVIVSVPLLRADLGLSLSAAGWVLSIFSVLGVLGGIPTGAAVSRFGDRRILLLGLVAIVIGSLAGGFASDYSVLLVTRVVEGLGFLLIIIAAPDLLRRIVAPHEQDRAFAIWSCFMPAGMALALLVGPFLVGWRSLWFANALLAAFVIIAVMRYVSQGMIMQDKWSWSGLSRDTMQTLKADGPLLLAATFALYTLLFFALFSFLPVLLEERMGVSAALASVLTAAAIGANIIGNLAAGALRERGVAQWKIISVASIVMGVTGLGVFLPILPNLAVFGACVAFSAFGGLIPAIVMGGIPTLTPSDKLAPVSFGLVMQGNNLGQLIGPVAIGGVVGAMGWNAVAVFIAGGGVVVVLLALALRRSFQHAKMGSTAS